MADEDSLVVKFLDQLWMTIRRVDRKKDRIFSRFHGAEIGPRGIEIFLPNWRTLAWEQVEESDLSRGE